MKKNYHPLTLAILTGVKLPGFNLTGRDVPKTIRVFNDENFKVFITKTMICIADGFCKAEGDSQTIGVDVVSECLSPEEWIEASEEDVKKMFSPYFSLWWKENRMEILKLSSECEPFKDPEDYEKRRGYVAPVR